MFAVDIPVVELREGDRIATKYNSKTRVVSATSLVRELVPQARGCRNTHVNGSECWDRAGFVTVAR